MKIGISLKIKVHLRVIMSQKKPQTTDEQEVDNESVHNESNKTCLRDKKCVPCNLKELQPMTEDAAHILMPHVSEWNFVKEDSIFKLKRTRKVKTFTKGLEFFKIVADLAESEVVFEFSLEHVLNSWSFIVKNITR
ncbi:hypothetical protein Ahy_B03g064265 isoform A [Arachis hypogaea]|uniref:4a-hydroxytetrahydrobiopterin dehydratase n=2 Tax=Arachis hypogaea TaxID=3818 RepID=A0A444ZZ86_ARAHY|nr:hypothetical protein Ahy_B03g064265 isoform A [Arachis hypogaea]